MTCPGLSRRRVLKLGILAAASASLSRSLLANLRDSPVERALSLHNLHTGESLRAVYWAEGRHVPEGLAGIEHILRDFRTAEQHQIDTRLLDLLSDLAQTLETKAPYQIISGYRSPKTNAQLREHGEGVAKHSLHMEGKAVDIRLAGRPLTTLRKAAIALRRGGVGMYPASDFVHVDVGRVRYW